MNRRYLITRNVSVLVGLMLLTASHHQLISVTSYYYYFKLLNLFRQQ